MTLPGAIVIGSPRAGTTSFCQSLEKHPGIFMYREKEARFFDRYYDWGIDWYTSLFDGAEDGQLAMEGTPGYTQGKRAREYAERMARHLPDVKLVFIARNPIDRLTSHYVQSVGNLRLPVPMDEMIRERDFLVETSLYHTRLQDFLAFFPREQLHVMLLEDLLADRDQVVADCLEFLGVDPSVRLDLIKTNTRETRLQDRPSTHGFLDALRTNKLWHKVRPLIPRRMKQNLKEVVRKKVNVPDAWSDPALIPAEEIARMRADADLFLDMIGKPRDFWDITPRAAAAE
ncbi:sulfotransferase family protein [Parvularcula lutaonensis]|uniref:Sulfotransferase family protein n=1 Tax=Parvularcula lutaonensis TaxID=491923 RepID=A0ABV7MD86_9PROT|nr:sulfotransferase [Parvularcula lutaonensis]GGY51994.1 sulfotransferase [Parvularcula lutaonensis]